MKERSDLGLINFHAALYLLRFKAFLALGRLIFSNRTQSFRNSVKVGLAYLCVDGPCFS